MPQNLAIWRIEMTVSSKIIPALEEIIFASGKDGDFPTTSNFEIIEGDEMRLLHGFFNQKPDMEKLCISLNEMAIVFGENSAEITLTQIKDQDWVSASQKLLVPVDTGRFFLYGSHDADKCQNDRINILMEAGQAFGTGQHETTYGCLKAIGDLENIITPAAVLDLGCGSGVLAIAMAKIWSEAVIIASDIDPIAVQTTLQNAVANNIPLSELAKNGALTALASDGFQDSNLSGKAPFDVITANILAKPLQMLAGDITDHLKDNGHLILSGLLDVQERDVLKSYKEKGWILKKSYALAQWRALYLIKE